VDWLGVAVLVVAVVGVTVALFLDRRGRRRGPVCPWCGQPDTFADGDADVCENCGFDFWTDDY
jgi:hypothetical protein